MNRNAIFTYLSLIACMQACSPSVSKEPSLEPFTKVTHKPLNEISGISKSALGDFYWVHNDSGDDPRLFAIDIDGQVIMPDSQTDAFYGESKERGKKSWQGFPISPADNNDWEDISIANGYLYIADVGNNSNTRRDLGIYVVKEFDPQSESSARVTRYLPVSYPEQIAYPGDQWHYDSESLFVANNTVYLITKHRVAGKRGTWEPGARLYRLDSEYTETDNPLTLVDMHSELTAATAAELSPDGQQLAVLSYSSIWVFDKPTTGDKWLSSSSKKLVFDRDSTQQVEAVTWENNDTLIITNEQRDLFRISLSSLID